MKTHQCRRCNAAIDERAEAAIGVTLRPVGGWPSHLALCEGCAAALRGFLAEVPPALPRAAELATSA